MVQTFLVPFIERQDLTNACIELINEEWPKSEQIRRISLERSSRSDPPMAFLFLDSEQNLIGFARFLHVLNCSQKTALFDTIVIRSSLRRGGFGRILMDLLKDEAKKRDYELLIICTQDKETFYEKCGYKKCKFLSLVTKLTPSSGNLATSMNFDKPIPLEDNINFVESKTQSTCPIPPPPLPIKSTGYKVEQYMFMYI